VSKPSRPVKYQAADWKHLSIEERFLLFFATQVGSARASRCITIDMEAAEKEWKAFTNEPFEL